MADNNKKIPRHFTKKKINYRESSPNFNFIKEKGIFTVLQKKRLIFPPNSTRPAAQERLGKEKSSTILNFLWSERKNSRRLFELSCSSPHRLGPNPPRLSHLPFSILLPY
jgi:hypothetical protein